MQNLQYLMHRGERRLGFIQFFQELGISSAPILILSDSETAQHLTNRMAVNHRNAKHIELSLTLAHHILKDKFQVGHLPATDNIVFTKDRVGYKNDHANMASIAQ